MSELETLSSQIQHPSCKVDYFEGQVASIHNEIGKMKLWKEQILKRVSNFRESITLKVSFVKK